MIQETYDVNYWKDRKKFELKHQTLASSFIKHFDLPIDAKVLDYGCGTGGYVHALRSLSVDAIGYDPSEFAVENAYEPVKEFIFSDVMKIYDTDIYPEIFDLVLCIDVLEHLKLEELKSILKCIKEFSNKHFVFSICFDNNSDFDLDKTHIAKRSKQWCVDFLTIFGFKVSEDHINWIYGDQFLICEKV